MTDAEPKPDLEIKSDADWKKRVKQEAAQLDAQREVEPAGSSGRPARESDAEEPTMAAESAAESFDPSKLPPADFTMLVTMFSTQAMVSLGVVPSPETGKPEPNLPLARHFIDLLGVLQDKTKRNLTGHEANLLEGSLHELRMAYVELSQSAYK